MSRNLRAIKRLPFHTLQAKSTAQVAQCTKLKVLWFWYLQKDQREKKSERIFTINKNRHFSGSDA